MKFPKISKHRKEYWLLFSKAERSAKMSKLAKLRHSKLTVAQRKINSGLMVRAKKLKQANKLNV
jgi:hypothetical protein